MPVTLNPPPFPMADNSNKVASDKPADASGEPRDAFAAHLLAAEAPPASANKDSANSAPSNEMPSNGTPGTAPVESNAQPVAGRANRIKGPVVTLPVVGRAPALVPASTGADAAAESDAVTSDKPIAADSASAVDLAAMAAAALGALLGGRVANDNAKIVPASDASEETSAALRPAIDPAGTADARAKRGLGLSDAEVETRANLAASTTAGSKSSASAPGSEAEWSAIANARLKPDGPLADAKPVGRPSDMASVQASMAGMQHAFGGSHPTSIGIATAVTDPGWAHEFADKLSQVVMTGNDRVEFRVHPADLGPVQVNISVTGDQASVVITASHADTRDALEQALPQLRDLLAGQGITLGQASVQSEQRPADQGRQAQDFGAAKETSSVVETAPRVLRLNGLVDVFA